MPSDHQKPPGLIGQVIAGAIEACSPEIPIDKGASKVTAQTESPPKPVDYEWEIDASVGQEKYQQPPDQGHGR